jgi:hypothetical protein
MAEYRSQLDCSAVRSTSIHLDVERFGRSHVVLPGPAVFQAERCHTRGNGGQPELLRDRRTYGMARLGILLRGTLHQSEGRRIAFYRLTVTR